MSGRNAYLYGVVSLILVVAPLIAVVLNFTLSGNYFLLSYNFAASLLFATFYLFRKKNVVLFMCLTGLVFQWYIFLHAFYFLPGKQIETGLGAFTAVAAVFYVRHLMWYFVVSNTLLFHLAVWKADYPQYFILEYIFYIGIFLVIRAIIKENRIFENELLIQRNKIQKDAQALKELDALKTRFFTNISHELRTPLTLILGPLRSVLNRNKLTNKDYTYLKLMEQNGQHLLVRINELLDLSRLDAQQLAMNYRTVNLYDFIKQILVSFEGIAHLKGIQFSWKHELPPHLKLSLDAGKVQKIIQNYVSNAMKFTPKNGEIIVNVHRQDQFLKIAVQDTGQGIQSKDLPKVFDRFYQVESSKYQGGSGIGLAICQELAHLLGGEVGVESEWGKGSMFYVLLPYIESYAPIEQQATTLDSTDSIVVEDIPSKKLDRPFNLLVVEDNVDLQQYIQLILQDEYAIQAATNGKTALELLTSTSPFVPDLIISDIMMPEMNGIELLKQIKSTDALRSIPVIMLTARQDLEVKIETLRIGVDDYLTKPFVEEELQARVANLINNSINRRPIAVAEASTSTPLSQKDMDWLAKVEVLIQQNMAQPTFNLQQLAQELNLSPRRFQQKMKAITGMTPKQYQRTIRLDFARKLLKSGKVQTVAEASYQTGFEDPHYFSTLYKKTYGKMPSEEL
jgi:signal transduction histidine kinase/DNA-binding response OmpR family regulator